MDQVIVRIVAVASEVKTFGPALKPRRLLLGREEMAAVERLAEREATEVRKVDAPGRGARVEFMGLPVEAVACRRCVGFELDHE
jgi:hypothetical protein